MNIAEFVNSCIQAVKDEPELPDEMPDEMFTAICKDKKIATEAMRILVRETKESIVRRLEVLPFPSPTLLDCYKEHKIDDDYYDLVNLMIELRDSLKVQATNNNSPQLAKRIAELEEQVSAMAMLRRISE